jgi:hypothetical protein
LRRFFYPNQAIYKYQDKDHLRIYNTYDLECHAPEKDGDQAEKKKPPRLVGGFSEKIGYRSS